MNHKKELLRGLWVESLISRLSSELKVRTLAGAADCWSAACLQLSGSVDQIVAMYFLEY